MKLELTPSEADLLCTILHDHLAIDDLDPIYGSLIHQIIGQING